MALTVRSEKKRKGVCVVTPVGSINSDTDALFDEKLTGILARKPSEIVLDMAHVDYLASGGVRVILKAKKQLNKSEGVLIMMNLQPQIRKVFEIINALPSMQIFTSVQELDAYLDRMQRKVLDGE